MESDIIARPISSNFYVHMEGGNVHEQEFISNEQFNSLIAQETNDSDISLDLSANGHTPLSIIQPNLLETMKNLIVDVGSNEALKKGFCNINPNSSDENLGVALKCSTKFYEKDKDTTEADNGNFSANLLTKGSGGEVASFGDNYMIIDPIKSGNYVKSFDKIVEKEYDLEVNTTASTTNTLPHTNMSEVKYIKLNKGTRCGRPKLFDSLGFSYSLMPKSSKYLSHIKWRCIIRTKNVTCPASVIEVGNEFTSHKKHCHPGNDDSFETSLKLKSQEKHINIDKEIIEYKKNVYKNCRRKSGLLNITKPQRISSINEKTTVPKSERNFIDNDCLDHHKAINSYDLKCTGNEEILSKDTSTDTGIHPFHCESKRNNVLGKIKISGDVLDEVGTPNEIDPKFEVQQTKYDDIFREKNSKLNDNSSKDTPVHKLELRKRKKNTTAKIAKKEGSSRNKKIKYIMLPNGTIAGNPKLIDSLGFSYVRNSFKLNLKIIKWNCIKRSKFPKCPSSVIEIKRMYKRINDHSHEANPDSYSAAMKLKKKKLALAQSPKISKVTRPKLKNEKILFKNRISKQSCVFLKGKHKNNEPIIIDKVTGYCYISKMKCQSDDIFKCLQSMSEMKCRASIKKVGKSYIQSSFKHHHPSNPKDMKLLNKKAISKFKDSSVIPMKHKTLKRNVQKLHQFEDRKNSSNAGTLHTIEKNIEGLDVHMFDNIVLTKELEVELSLIFKSISNIGLSHDANMLLYIEASKSFFDKMQLNCFPPNNLPSKEWVDKFIRRHPVLSSLKLDRLKIYSDVDYSQIYQLLYYNFQKAFKDSYNMDASEYLNGQYSDRIFCLDVIELIINTAKLVVTLEMKNLKTLEDGQRTMTVLCCLNSLGNSIKPLIINKGQLPLNYERNADIDGKYNIANSFSGFLTKEVFQDWLILFDKEVELMNILKPVVLFLNGNFPLISYASVVLAKSANIFLYYFPSHVSNNIHPFRHSIFKELKIRYLKRFESALEETSTDLPREQFPSIFIKAYEDNDFAKLAKDAFLECGLCPFNFEFSKKMKDDKPSQSLEMQDMGWNGGPINSRHEIIPKNPKISSGKGFPKGRKRQLCAKITYDKYDTKDREFIKTSDFLCNVRKSRSSSAYTESPCENSITNSSVMTVLNEVNEGSCEKFHFDKFCESSLEVPSIKSSATVLNANHTKLKISKKVKKNSFKGNLQILSKLRTRSNHYGNYKLVKNRKRSDNTPGSICNSEIEDLGNSNSTMSKKDLETLTKTQNSVIGTPSMSLNFLNENVMVPPDFNYSSVHKKKNVRLTHAVKVVNIENGGKADTNIESSSVQENNPSPVVDILQEKVSNSFKESLTFLNMDASPIISEPSELLDTEAFKLREGYNLALHNIEDVFEKIIDPSVIDIFRQKLKANVTYRDTTFLLWRSLQMLKSSPHDLLKD